MQKLSEPESIDLLELSARTRVSPRTIRYYIQQGLLPTPEARGPGAHYSVEYVDRLNLIRRLQSEHLPLSEIRKRIEKLNSAEIRKLVRAEPKRAPDS
ncbi:MAG: MerR family transcriptional regulator, partial [Gemmatimonadales bacterium]